jgi:fused signal recognition particle receptor
VVQPVPPGEVGQLNQRLSKTRGALWGGLRKFWDRSAEKALQSEEWEQLEEALLGGDVGVATTQRLLEKVKLRLREQPSRGLRDLIEEESLSLFGGLPHGAAALANHEKPFVISIVGVNGVGKTTTIGKLARRLTSEGRTVLLGAVDTFRAAAISQLKIWADRSGAQFVTGREGADPGAVAFDSVTAGKARGVDVVLLDTAGRLHTKTNLMEELKKVHRVVKKVIPEAPHEVWLVVDGTLGQNSIQQAREFQKTLDLTGVIITKLDGTAKGGAVLAIASELKLPIRYIGVGESAEDLIPFEPKPFVEAILGGP